MTKAIVASANSHQWLVNMDGNKRHINPPLTWRNFLDCSDLTLNFLWSSSEIDIKTTSISRKIINHSSWEFIRLRVLSGKNTHYIAYNCIEKNFLDHTEYSHSLQDTGIPGYYLLDIYRKRKPGRDFYCDQFVYRLAWWHYCQSIKNTNWTWR